MTTTALTRRRPQGTAALQSIGLVRDWFGHEHVEPAARPACADSALGSLGDRAEDAAVLAGDELEERFAERGGLDVEPMRLGRKNPGAVPRGQERSLDEQLQARGNPATTMRGRMRCVIQRVRRASVTVGADTVGDIAAGLVVLAAVEKGDAEATMTVAAKKIRELRIFADESGKMNRDVAEAGGSILAISQFTLAGSIDKGRRPGFDRAEAPERARVLFDFFAAELAATGLTVATGRFREHMIVSLENDGPVTFVYESS